MAWIGAVVGIAGSLISSSMASDASSEASAAQQAASREAVAEQRRQYDLTRQDLAPWRDVGSQAVTRLGTLLGLGAPNATGVTEAQLRASGRFGNPVQWVPGSPFQAPGQWVGSGDTIMQEMVTQYRYPDGSVSDQPFMQIGSGIDEDALQAELARLNALGADPEYGSLMQDFSLADFEKDPGYEFRLSEGNKAIDRAASARGSFDSGATLKALLKYGQDFASNEFQNAWNRDASNKTRKYNFLAGTSGLGQTSANTLAVTGQNMANNVSDLLVGAGNARAAGIVGSSNAWQSGIQGAANSATQAMALNNLTRGNPYGTLYQSGGDPYGYYDPGYGYAR